ncbi:sensor histidine kinase [Chelativorans sp. YIM 93263]|uniref:sensor histidine kinase n=1 Tax=Chelativorans sp. YIM 93263 TaxID=2906648 RepID=UPI002378E783|nr:PAS domain S-box protein [Chelativorans sp. YIM 93263]
MASASYSFLDIAVLDAVRERFAAGEALGIVSTNLTEILWANGAGARWLGYADIEAAIGNAPRLPAVALRQIAATHGFPHIGNDRHIALRVTSGLKSRIVDLQASTIVLPRGEEALLLALKPEAESRSRVVEGFSQPGHFAALIDLEGKAVTATEGFDALGISGATLKGLILDVGSVADRLVKRHIKGKRSFPAGMARLSDDPALHLLVVVDEGEAETVVEEPANATPEPPPVVRDELEPVTEDGKEDADPIVESAPEPKDAPERMQTETRPEPAPNTIRFTWRTDAEGRFTAISPAFVEAMGEETGNVVGQTFREVSKAFDLDPEGAIAQQMGRRDTWSGLTVTWPLSGSDFKVPVDLAALPAYGRGRIFEGFRGFGIARLGEARIETPAQRREQKQVEGTVSDAMPLQSDPKPAASGEGLEPEDSSHAETKPDPFMGEEPALRISESPNRRIGDKVIHLAEHREVVRETGLTVSERTAFREIGERLRRANQALADRLEQEKDTETQEREETSEPTEALPTPDVEESNSAEGPANRNDLLDADQEERLLPDERPEQDQETPVAPSEAPAAETEVDTSLLARLPLPILIHSGDRLHYANRELLRFTGYADLAALEEAGGIGALFDEREEAPSEENAPEALRLRTAQGESLPVEAHLQSIPWEGRTALMLALHALPDNASAEGSSAPGTVEALNARLGEMRAIIDTATDGIAVIEGDGTIRSINRPAEALFGFDADHVIGKPFTSLFAIESQRTVQDYLTALADNGVASVLNDGRQVIGREAQGGFIPLFITIGRLPDSGGFCAVLRDVTSWKRAEEELTQARAQAEHASAQKSEFLARVSHEIRTPLNAIIGFSELMIDEKFGPIGNDRYRDYLRDINRSGNHVLDLVNDLLDISKIEAGQQEMRYEAVSLNETLGQVVAMMQPQANGERVIIRSSFASRLPEVVADHRTVRQIAFNLLSNAVRYTPAGGQIIVSTAYSTDGSVTLRVRDTGVGMNSAELDEALKPFKQINALRRKPGGGTGLGLPLTRAMVEANRAQFYISSNPGEGTLVEVTFPPTRVLAD